MLDVGNNKRQGSSGGLSSRPSQISPEIRRDRGTTLHRQNRSSSSQPTAAQREEQALKNRRGLQPSRQGQRYGSADAIERRSNPATSRKERSPNIRGMSADAAEAWSNPANRPKPKPNLRGMSADAAEAWSNPVENREARLGSNRRPTPTHQPPSKLSRAPTPKIAKRSDSDRNQTGNWFTRTQNTISNWAQRHSETISNVGHTILDGAGFIPVVGAAADVVNGIWYVAEGKETDAAFSFGAAVPFAGDAVAAARGVNRLTRAASVVGRATNVAGVAEGGIHSVQYARQGDWRSAGVAFSSTVLGGVNPARSARGVGTVANVTDKAGEAAATARRTTRSGSDGSSVGDQHLRRRLDSVHPRQYVTRGGVTTNQSKKERPVFRREIEENVGAQIAKHRQMTGEAHPVEGKLGNYNPVTKKFKLRSDLEAGHTVTSHEGGQDRFALEDLRFNRGDSSREKKEILGKPTVEIYGIPIEKRTANKLFPDLAEGSPSHPGWHRNVKINSRGIDVATSRLSDEQIARLQKIAEGEKIDWGKQEDRELYRDYYQALMDSRPSVKNKG